MNAEDIRKGITKAVRHHLWLDSAMSVVPVEDYDEKVRFLEVAQVAMSIWASLIPTDAEVGDPALAQDSRAFLVECGMPESFAKWLISDDQPNAIY